MYNFNAEEMKDRCVEWIRDFFKNNGPDCNAVVGISGGKDSFILAVLMRMLQRYSDFKFDIEFISMDPGYNNKNKQGAYA